VLASPAVRALARELAVDLAYVAGSGQSGRVLKEDVLAAAERPAAGGPFAAAAAAASMTHHHQPHGGLEDAALALGRAVAATAMAAAEEAPAERHAHGDHGAAAAHGFDIGFAATSTTAATGPAPTRVPLHGYRRAMVKSATEAAAVPTFHYMDELQMDELIRVRAQLKDEAGAMLGAGARLTYLPFVVKALSVALGRFPGLNAQIAPGGSELLQLHTHNIGVAMATPSGLVVPNVKGVGLVGFLGAVGGEGRGRLVCLGVRGAVLAWCVEKLPYGTLP